ncbi:MAG: MalT protein, partial [Acidobacteriota bacterium]|nr:MalT protein [Acidobacteriota bacterium]
MTGHQPLPACNLDGALLARFAEGETSVAERRRVLRHLLSGCATCRSSLAPKIRLLHDSRPSEFSISGVLANVAEVEHRMNQERAHAAGQFQEFLKHPPPRQWTLLRNSRRFDNWSFCELLLDTGFDAI